MLKLRMVLSLLFLFYLPLVGWGSNGASFFKHKIEQLKIATKNISILQEKNIANSTNPSNSDCSETSIYIARDNGQIESFNLTTGTGQIVTTSPYTNQNLNALAANPDAGIVYYGIGKKVYYWNPNSNQHGTLINLASYFSGNESLSSGGGAYYNGHVYMGSEDDNPGGNPKVYRIPVSANGLSTTGNPVDLNIPINPNTSWGDLIVTQEKNNTVIYGGCGRNGSASGSIYFRYIIELDFYSLVNGNMPTALQVAVDVNGDMWGAAHGGTTMQRMNRQTGDFYGNVVSLGTNIWDMTGPFNCPQLVEICGNGIDDDGDGLIDNADPECTTLPRISDNCDVPIPSSGGSTHVVTSTLEIAENGTIQDIKVTKIDIEHTYINDLIVKLTSPDGTQVTLINRPCGSENDILLALDDDSNLTLNNCPINDNEEYKPANPLSAFQGENIHGTWTLTVEDIYPWADGGTVNCWALEFISEHIPQNEICDNGIDDDGDGLIDANDPDCPSLPDEICDNGIDDDGDGLIDTNDPDCPGTIDINNNNNCTDKPFVFVPCYVDGNPLGGGSAAGMDAFVMIPYDSVGTNMVQGERILADFSEIGATWGVAIEASTKTVFTSSVLKRHTGLGAINGNTPTTGGIFAFNDELNLIKYVDVNTLGVNTGANPRDNTVANGLSANAGVASYDVATYDLVGKVGIGDIDYDPVHDVLWFVNLYDRSLYGIRNVNVNTTPTAADILGPYQVPNPGCGSGANDVRPWALAVRDRKVYVGAVCAAETSQDSTDLHAYVFEFNPLTPGTDMQSVFDFDLNYERGNTGYFLADDGDWSAWQSAANVMSTLKFKHQPILSDIEFDDDGSMILGFMDRLGLQGGFKNYYPDINTSNTTLVTSIAVGDVIRVCNVGGNFVLQGGGGCEIKESCTFNSTYKGMHCGPGGGEYYWGDFGGGAQNQFAESAFGSLALLPNSGEVAITQFDPFSPNHEGGLGYLNNSTGGANRRFRVYRNSGFGKAVGLGDIEISCIKEICDNVYDDDGDGNTDCYDSDCGCVPPPTFDCTAGLLNNPDFESGATGWNLTPNTSISTDSYFGNRAAHANGSVGGVEQSHAAVAGETFVLNVYAKKNASENVTISLRFYDNSNNELVASYRNITSNEYMNYSVSLKAPANTAWVRAIGWKDNGAGQAWWDGFCMEKWSVTTPVCDSIDCKILPDSDHYVWAMDTSSSENYYLEYDNNDLILCKSSDSTIQIKGNILSPKDAAWSDSVAVSCGKKDGWYVDLTLSDRKTWDTFQGTYQVHQSCPDAYTGLDYWAVEGALTGIGCNTGRTITVLGTENGQRLQVGLGGNANSCNYGMSAIFNAEEGNKKVFARLFAHLDSTCYKIIRPEERVCDSLLMAGTIAGNESTCAAQFDPSLINSIDDGSGGAIDVVIEYRWQKFTIGDSDWQDISGATTNVYDPPSISYTTRYRRLARRGICATSWLISNEVTKTVLNGAAANIIAYPDSLNEHLCSATSYTFEAANVGAGVTYSWNFGPNASPTTRNGIGPHNISFSSSGGTSTNEVSLTVTNNGCTSKDSIVFSIYPVIPGVQVNSQNPSSCGGANGRIEVTLNGPPNLCKRISLNGGTTWQADNQVIFPNLAAGVYDVVIDYCDAKCPINYGQITLVKDEDIVATQDEINSSCPGFEFNGNVAFNDFNIKDATYTLIANPVNGTLEFNANGAFKYTPTIEACVMDTFSYRVCQTTTGCCDSAIVLISFDDNEAPELHNVPDDITINCDEEIPITPLVSAFDNCPVITIDKTETSTQGENACHLYEYGITRTWTSTDLCGNSTTEQQVIEIQDNTAPDIYRIYILPNGKRLIAGVMENVTHRWKTIQFPIDFEASPMVLTQIISTYDTSKAVVRMRNISTAQFEMKLQEEEAHDQLHKGENIAWIALEEGANMGDFHFEGKKITADDNPTLVTYDQPFATAPAIFSSMQTIIGADPAYSKTLNETANSVQIKVEEEISSDSEKGHFSESIAYLAIDTQAIIKNEGGELIGEVKIIDISNNAFIYVAENKYYNPVVIANYLDEGSNTPIMPHVRIINTDSFEISLDTWDYLSNTPSSGKIALMIVEGSLPLNIDYLCIPNSDSLILGRDLIAVDNCNMSVPFELTEKIVYEGAIKTIERTYVAIDDCGNETRLMQSVDCQGVGLRVTALLQGALPDDNSNLMRDDLRKKKLIPHTEPYTDLEGFKHFGAGGGEVLDTNILLQTGENAIVDWVLVELREVTNPSNIVATLSALIQRDGDLVSFQGDSVLVFDNVLIGDYYVSLKHRNHLGIFAQNPYTFGPTSIPYVDFTNLFTPVMGNNPGVDVNGKRGLWSGDLNADAKVIFQGPQNDVFHMLLYTLLDEKNQFFLTNFISKGYSQNDFNMDGVVSYQGPGNDRSPLLYKTVLNHPDNDSKISNFVIQSGVEITKDSINASLLKPLPTILIEKEVKRKEE
jgi:subtilisin-like proprotein convertase family protein